MGGKDTFLTFLGSSDGVNFKILYRYFITKNYVFLCYFILNTVHIFVFVQNNKIRPKVFVFTCTIHSVPYCNLSCHTSCKQWHPGAARWEHGCGHFKAVFGILINNVLV